MQSQLTLDELVRAARSADDPPEAARRRVRAALGRAGVPEVRTDRTSSIVDAFPRRLRTPEAFAPQHAPASDSSHTDRARHTAGDDVRTITPEPPLSFADEEERSHYQHRMGRAFALLGALRLGLWIAENTFFVISRPVEQLAPRLTETAGLELAEAALLFGASLLCRGRSRSGRYLGVLDAAVFALASLLTGLVPVFSRAEKPAELVAAASFVLLAVLRAAIVPGAPRWTFALSAGGGAIVSLLAFVAMRVHLPHVVSTVPVWARLLHVTVWCVVAVAGAVAVSRVVYGLRAQVREATRLGQYTLEAKIGEGGMGVVYRARHALLQRPTAIKLLDRTRMRGGAARRFEREVQVTSRLKHPNTVSIYDYGHTLDGVFYYVMELLDGVSLQDLVDREGPQPPGRVVHLLAQVVGALAEAHELGLVHRDIKPANIVVTGRVGPLRDFVKVLDFGLVKEIDGPDVDGGLLGTPAYMAPECFLRPTTVDARADLYAVGILGYFLLVGDEPFRSDTLTGMCKQHLVGPIPAFPAGVPRDLEQLLRRCLAKSPENRPASAAEVLADLVALRRAEPLLLDEGGSEGGSDAASPSGARRHGAPAPCVDSFQG